MREDPRRFLALLAGGAVSDEIQRVPELLSYLQVLADEHGGNSLYVLTGRQQLQLCDRIGQYLAGRTALLRRLPFSIAELERMGASARVDDMLHREFRPRIYRRRLDPQQALGDYFET